VFFPFIIEYARSFKDSFDVYFLVEYVKGIELFDVIRDIGKKNKRKNNGIIMKKITKIDRLFCVFFLGLLNTYDSQFYVASMILILEYLHHQNVIYRDMKPENIMVDEQVIQLI